MLVVTLFASGSAVASDPVRRFQVGTENFSESEIVDARALPELGGGAAIMLTLDKDGANRLAALTKVTLEGTVSIMLDDVELARPVVREEIKGGVLVITGAFTLTEAAALAKRISGKDPLPTELEE